jgi:hypothetical protein
MAQLAALLSSRRRRGAMRGRVPRGRRHRESAAVDLTKLLTLGSRLLPLRQGHHLQGGTVRAHPSPLACVRGVGWRVGWSVR